MGFFGSKFKNQLVGLLLFNANWVGQRCDELLSVGRFVLLFDFEKFLEPDVNSNIFCCYFCSFFLSSQAYIGLFTHQL